MPTFSKVSHISFSARDAEKSAEWWARVFDLKELDRAAGEGWRAILLIHPPTATIIEFQQHDDNRGEPFDPRRTGFDHMGFKVDSRAELDDWRKHFERLGVTHSPIADREYGSVLTFKDPDGIQFEMFYRENHP
ncbi:MAG TPA: VOC family protein [Mycobacterium sp.]|nr:VOC family protein [Mycobacterium sp.]